jgi:formylglycine-generating enzyme required for sulfatase activity
MHPFLMKSLLLIAFFFAAISPSWAAPVVSNVRVSQRTGTNLVDVYYNLSGSGAGGATVSVELSDNSGTSYGLPISSLSGHVGSGIANGNNRYLVWNAGSDRPNSFSTTMRLRVTASEAPDGFALIPAGAFTMGRTSGDTDSNAPPVTVTVSAFYMGKYEVTKALWDEVRVWGASNGYTDLRVGGGKAANHPVHSISWFDMVKWCNARSQRDGLTPVYTVSGAVMRTGTSAPAANWSANGYRLPTEAEWEKAARGGVSGKRFPSGSDTISHSQANYYANSFYSYDSSGAVNNYHPTYAMGSTPYSSPVGSFAPNGYGLYDMAGNMWEWCWDWYGASTYVNGATNPRGPTSGSRRVGRGGGWGYNAIRCRAADRISNNPGNTINFFGFRLARNSVP